MKSAAPHPAILLSVLHRALNTFYLRGIHTRARYAREWQEFLAALRKRKAA